MTSTELSFDYFYDVLNIVLRVTYTAEGGYHLPGYGPPTEIYMRTGKYLEGVLDSIQYYGPKGEILSFEVFECLLEKERLKELQTNLEKEIDERIGQDMADYAEDAMIEKYERKAEMDQEEDFV